MKVRMFWLFGSRKGFVWIKLCFFFFFRYSNIVKGWFVIGVLVIMILWNRKFIDIEEM